LLQPMCVWCSTSRTLEVATQVGPRSRRSNNRLFCKHFRILSQHFQDFRTRCPQAISAVSCEVALWRRTVMPSIPANVASTLPLFAGTNATPSAPSRPGVVQIVRNGFASVSALLRRRIEQAIVDKYACHSWCDSTERQLNDDIANRRIGWR
jgi:hypothetical protein